LASFTLLREPTAMLVSEFHYFGRPFEKARGLAAFASARPEYLMLGAGTLGGHSIFPDAYRHLNLQAQLEHDEAAGSRNSSVGLAWSRFKAAAGRLAIDCRYLDVGI
jgi:hypothetical protein